MMLVERTLKQILEELKGMRKDLKELEPDTSVVDSIKALIPMLQLLMKTMMKPKPKAE